MKRITLFLVAGLLLFSSGAEARHHRHHNRHHYVTSGTIVPHPSGCPYRQFCGCGASVAVFGRPVRNLYLAANWFRFPRTSPAPGMVAVRRHHVFVLRQQTERGWLVYDANSGGHMTRVHERSLSGYVIVNPHA